MAEEALQNGEDTAPLSVKDSVRAAIETLTEVDDAGNQADADQKSVAADVQGGMENDEHAELDEVSAEDASTTDEVGDGEPVDGADKGEPEEVILAPASWSKEDREAWDKLPRETQAIVARRESERDKALNATQTEFGPLRKVVEEFEDYFDQRGVSPAESFRMLVNAERSLQYGTPQQKTEALLQIARQYGIDVPTGAPEPQEIDGDPELTAYQKQIDERFGKLESQLTSRQQADDLARTEENTKTAARFFDELEGEKPEDAPEVRYIEQVLPRFNEMVSAELRAGNKPDVAGLREIYRDAAWSLPSVRDAMQSDIAARQKARTVTRTVKKTSSSASGGSGRTAHSEDPPKTESVRDTVRRSMAELEKQQSGVLR